MDVSVVDFKTGWLEVQIEVTKEDIDKLVFSLKNLRESIPSAHFHCSNDYKGSGGVGELEISLRDKDRLLWGKSFQEQLQNNIKSNFK